VVVGLGFMTAGVSVQVRLIPGEMRVIVDFVSMVMMRSSVRMSAVVVSVGFTSLVR